MKNKLTILLCLFCLAGNVLVAQNSKPNFIIILADDLGFADLSLNGSKQIATPHIDKLAEGGINFTNGYVSGPVCSPSRAGLLTGRNQVTFGHDNNLSGVQPGFDIRYNGLPLTETTIATCLKKLGYVTGLIGKWHLGEAHKFHPLQRGFDEMWGYTGGGHDYFTSEPDGKGYKCPIECNYKTPQSITYITDDKGDECVDFIKRHKNEPFFLFASFNAPHAPMQATEADLQLFKHVKDEKRRKYCAMVHRLDVNVGRIMDALGREGLAENTLVVFLSDNGGPCDSNASINAPFNGQKGILLEGGIHVPFIMAWKGKLKAGTTYENPVISLDFAATFFELAGGEVTGEVKFDGVNLMPYLLGASSGHPHESFNWRFTISAAIREGNWKLVRLPDRLPLLFDLSKDISEQNNVALQNLEVTESLLKKLGEWDVMQPHPVFLEGAVWKARQLKLYDNKYTLIQPD
ncbi:sulfatase [Prolixibacteraceae bacterium Z1-6]|uniref:Sulfatase n=1 Tax=Draconibacterium aestuarii TaxID=2998507 RepID=A0A9X3FA60_9BACT|nr:sulfatase [Prolixibacteraceae bacterium Z1-6]